MKKLNLTAALLAAAMLAGCGSTVASSSAAASAASSEAAPASSAAEAASSSEASATMANPWEDTDADGIMEATGLKMGVPSNAENVTYQVNKTLGIGQMQFNPQGATAECCARIKSTGSAEDISGANFTWEDTESWQVGGVCDATFGKAKDGDKTIEIITWFDAVPGISYSLTAEDTDLDGFDILGYAEEIYSPMQGEATGDAETLSGKNFSVTYDPTLFYGACDGTTADISYTGEAAGSNVITISDSDAASAKDAMDIIKKDHEGLTDAAETEFFGYKGYTCSTANTEASSGSGLSVIDTWFALEQDGKVITIDVFNTAEPDEAKGYAISDSIEGVLGTLTIGDNGSAVVGSVETLSSKNACITYDPALFYGVSDGSTIDLSYTGEAAGSNVISISDSDAASAKDAMDAIKKDHEGLTEPSETEFFGYKGYYCSTANAEASSGSGLSVTDTWFALEQGGKVITLDIFNTAEPDEAKGYAISDAIEEVLGTLCFN